MCLVHVAEEYLNTTFNVIEIAWKCIQKGYISFNTKNYDDEDNFWVNYPEKILNMLTGVEWEVVKEYDPNYIPKRNEYAIELWSKNGKTGHFAMTKKGFNSLQKSYCVDEGKIISYRICRVVG